jgi:CheY-like chemotaxis protein
LTRQLLAFSRKQILQPKALNLNNVIREMDGMLQRLIGERIELIDELDPTLGHVLADPSQIEQVLMNLTVNACDAMPEGGKLVIKTANTDLDKQSAQEHKEAQPGRYALLAVSDTGHGMDADTRMHIFEPFFTTKEQGKGTGLGLSTVYGIIKQSGGHIRVHSEPGEGATFEIYLPRVDPNVEQIEDKEARGGAPPPGRETVLLVEDESMVRSMTREVLEESGYRVIDATNGNEAITICRLHAGPIHLMLTDVVMPGVSGRELADSLCQLRPHMRVLYMSGYTDDAVVHQGVLDDGVAFIEKPFMPDALIRKVRQVLETRPGGPGYPGSSRQ